MVVDANSVLAFRTSALHHISFVVPPPRSDKDRIVMTQAATGGRSLVVRFTAITCGELPTKPA
ncbi:hypothetical protein GGD66_002212 [Bradyrhizobium sp. CIR48]|uniref:hypothetical protein n=1 Tax=Bradyrhizobium sp. CIR48 TaxID=2663840 RepID=UPI001606BC5B|nr:hypothetical protein [Bradyrhizobium sp. CIR48]MBB4423668.1 hypothetical protein [Bradyrhizobium sp. CIR48]